MAYKGNPGANALAKVLSYRMQQESASPLLLDFGSIGTDYSLTTNTFPVPVPKSDYTVCRHVSGLTMTAAGGEHKGHQEGNGSHSHAVAVPALTPGDRVLVAWVQNEAVIIDIIVAGRSL